jgi:hypothetical protein
MAKSEKKWILVNIQSHEDFSSHMLNRDTWSDDTVVSLLRTSFVFWQRGHTSPDGQAYMRMHGITDADLPHIAIIDSRTGARIVTMKGFVSQSELSMALLVSRSYARMYSVCVCVCRFRLDRDRRSGNNGETYSLVSVLFCVSFRALGCAVCSDTPLYNGI